MTALDLSPAPAPAPPAKRIMRHGLIEARLLIRNAEQLLLALVIPLAILVAGRFASASMGNLALLGPSVLALAVWSSGFTSVAISTAFERRYGVLERLATTPLGKPGLLAGKALAVIMIMFGQLLILAGAALALGWRPAFTPLSAVLAVVVVILATATFVCLALLLAGRLRAESTLGLANLIYVILVIGGALIIPLERYPAVLRPVIEALPTAALGEGLRAAATGQLLGWPVLVLLAWLVAAGLAAWKGFRWTS
ncbi:MAG TPA: ABC transporter permease [Propionibacteriaceae bacterium]|nr:ABC transporter permease [Propionibacteriaceae bacterium]